MKALILIASLSLAASAQGLVSADGAQWKHFAIGKPTNGKKFDVYVRLPLGGTREHPELTVKTHGGPESAISLDCKRRLVRAGGESWVKAPRESVGGLLLKWACGKGAVLAKK